jgi:fructose-1,6-bisphosphatase/inositol monophosphatase family enzyme
MLDYMPEQKRGPINLEEVLCQRGFSDLAITAGLAVVSGAREVRAVHGRTSEELQIVYKVNEGMTPRTVADLRSGIAGNAVVLEKMPDAQINEEESGFTEGRGNRVDFDPLDGTSSFARGQRYSTTGIEIRNVDGVVPLAAAVVHPFEQELLVAESGRGTYLFPLDSDMTVVGEGERQEISETETLEGGIVYVDALFNNKTSGPKLTLMQRLVDIAGGNLGVRMTGSNIDQQRQVATGRAELTVTDAVGGFFDFSGRLPIVEAGGKFVDGQTLESVTEQTQVAIGGVPEIVDQVAPHVQEIYRGYTGFK